MSKIKINIKNQNYNVLIGNNLLKNTIKILIVNSIDFSICLLVIDNIEDPQNLGQIIRTAECANISGLLLSFI